MQTARVMVGFFFIIFGFYATFFYKDMIKKRRKFETYFNRFLGTKKDKNLSKMESIYEKVCIIFGGLIFLILGVFIVISYI